MEEPRARRWCLAFLLLALLLAGLFLWSLNAGSLPLTPCEVWDILVRREGEYAAVIWKLRLPRTLAAALLGGALSVSGFLLPTFFANPIASPFVLGISSGAKLTVSLAMVGLLSRGVVMSSGGMILAAFAGAMLSMGLDSRKLPTSAAPMTGRSTRRLEASCCPSPWGPISWGRAAPEAWG